MFSYRKNDLPGLVSKGRKTLLVKFGLIGKDASQRDIEEWPIASELVEWEIRRFVTWQNGWAD